MLGSDLTSTAGQTVVSRGIQVATGSRGHLRFLEHLQRRYTNALGFLPTAALEEFLNAGRVRIVFENGEPAGYVLGRWHGRPGDARASIVQAAVAMDAQRRGCGLAAVERFIEEAAQRDAPIVRCTCAADLEAVEFWRAAGFTEIARRVGGTRRKRQLVDFVKSLRSDQDRERAIVKCPAHPSSKDHLVRTVLHRCREA